MNDCEMIDHFLSNAIDKGTELTVYDGKNHIKGVIKGRLLDFPILVLSDGRIFEFAKQTLYKALIGGTILHV